MRLFLDADVIFSAAHNPGGDSRALFSLAAGGGVRLMASSYAVEEAVRNIDLKLPACAAELASLIERLSLAPEPSSALVGAAASAGLPDKDARSWPRPSPRAPMCL